MITPGNSVLKYNNNWANNNIYKNRSNNNHDDENGDGLEHVVRSKRLTIFAHTLHNQ